MKRFLLALAILAGASWLFCGFRDSAVRLRNESAARREVWLAQTQLLAQAKIQRTELTRRIRELKRNLANKPYGTSESTLADLIATNGPVHLSPEVRARLLAELGFDWNSSGDYVVVSKDTLHHVGLEAIRDNHLTDTVCGILAVTAQERATVEAIIGGLAADYREWATSHLERAEPEGDVLAKYSMPSDPQFTRSLSNTFSATVIAALGSERGELMLGYASSWMNVLRMVGSGPTILTIKRPAPGQEWLPFELHTPGGGAKYSGVSPYQPFPEEFRPIFPGGWLELAAREGIELPKEFQKVDTLR